MSSKIQVALAVKDQASKKLDAVRGRVHRLGAQFKREFNQMATLRNAAVVVAIGAITKKLIDAGSQVETFRAQLMAVSGSAGEASRTLDSLRAFAKPTALQTEDVIQSYIRLRAVGIQPTIEQMRTLGGVSMLFKRDMSSVSEALIGMEKEVLRRLGIEIDRTGSKAVITSGNIRKEVSKDTASIRKALVETWQERFPDALDVASSTFSGKMAVIQSKAWEFAADLSESIMPYIKSSLDGLSAGFDYLTENMSVVSGIVMTVIGAFRLLWNAFEIVGDSLVVGVRAIIAAIKSVGKQAWSMAKIAGDAFGNLGAIIGAVITGKWNLLPMLVEDMKNSWVQNTADIMDASEEFKLQLVSDTTVAAERLEQNYADMGDAVYQAVAAFKGANAEMKRESDALPGGGSFGESTAPGKKKSKSDDEATRKEIEKLQKRLEANKLYSDLIVDNIRDETERKMVIISNEGAERLAQAKIWYENDIISWERYQEMKTAIQDNYAKKREEITRGEVNSIVNASESLTHTLINIAEKQTRASKKEAKERKAVLRSLAIADAAAAAVKGIYDVWQGEGNAAYKVIMSLIVAAEIAASAASFISDINTGYARGTSFAGGGMAMVGEEGPEAMMVPRGSRVYTNYQTRNMNVGGDTINLSFPGDSDRNTVDYAVSKLDKWSQQRTYASRRGYLRFA